MRSCYRKTEHVLQWNFNAQHIPLSNLEHSVLASYKVIGMGEVSEHSSLVSFKW